MDREITAFSNRLRRALDSKEYKLVMIKEYNEHGYHLHVLFKCKSYQRLNSVKALFKNVWKMGLVVQASRLTDPSKITSYFFGNSISRTWDDVAVDEDFIKATKDDYKKARKKFILIMMKKKLRKRTNLLKRIISVLNVLKLK